MTLNARSLIEKGRRDIIEASIQFENHDILIFTETWWRDFIPSSILEFHNYSLAARSDRSTDPTKQIHTGGGVAIYVKLGIKYHSITNFNIQDYAQVAGIKIRDLQIVGVYRKPGDNFAFDQRLCEIISSTYTSDSVVIGGDMNLPHTDWDREIYKSRPAKRWGELVQEMALQQLVRGSTQDKGNQLDCIFVRSSECLNATDLKVENDLFTTLTDHFCISLNIEVIVNRDVKVKTVLDEKNMDWEKFKDSTRSSDILPSVQISSNPIEIWNKISGCILSARDSSCPTKEVKLGKSPAWISPSLQRSLRKEKRLRKLSNQISNGDVMRRRKRAWKFHHRILKKQVKKSRYDYEVKKILSYQKDSKSLFRDMKKARNAQTRDLPISSPDGAPLESNKDKAQAFQNQFLSVYSEPTDIDFQWPDNWGLNDIRFTPEEIKEEIKGMKSDSSPGKDRIGPLYYKNCDISVVIALCELYNCMFENTEFPPDFLNSVVIPIWKNKGKQSDVCTYRQITLLCVAFKIMESIIIKRIKAHLEDFDLNDKWQHGFQSKKSTITNLMTTWEYLSQTVDSGGGATCVSLDFSNAFDTLDLNHLLLALKSKGIGGKLGAFLEKWLKQRTQFVQVEGEVSTSATCGSGVPQGSHGGPTYFSILLSYVIENLPLDGAEKEVNMNIISFADDTRVTFEITSERHLLIAQRTLDILSESFKKVGLKLNASKSTVVVYGNNYLLRPLMIDGAAVQESNQSLELGCIFSNSMSFKNQLERNIAKAAAFVYTIRNSMKVRTYSVLKKLYMTYFCPIVLYASQIWAGDYVYIREALYRSFRNFWRLGNGKIVPTSDILDPYQLSLQNSLTFLFQSLRGENCLTHSNMFIEIEGVTRSATNGLLLIPKNRTKIRDAFYTTYIVNLFNNLPCSLRQSCSTNVFKKNLKEYIKLEFQRKDFDYRPVRVIYQYDQNDA